jgi:uncharacterized protein (DUF2236 family)
LRIATHAYFSLQWRCNYCGLAELVFENVVFKYPLLLPWPLKIGLELATRALLDPGDQPSVDFLRPAGEPALVSPDSVSWRVFKNPVSLFIGGVAAVIMELAEPRVRTGVWEHTTFRVDPIRRLRRTGHGLWCAQHGRGDDSPCSTSA